MKKLLIILTLFLAGCGSVGIPLTPRFPDAPVSLDAPTDLDTLQRGAKMSDLLECVNTNAGKYYDAAVRLSAWNKWYMEQSKLWGRK